MNEALFQSGEEVVSSNYSSPGHYMRKDFFFCRVCNWAKLNWLVSNRQRDMLYNAAVVPVLFLLIYSVFTPCLYFLNLSFPSSYLFVSYNSWLYPKTLFMAAIFICNSRESIGHFIYAYFPLSCVTFQAPSVVHSEAGTIHSLLLLPLNYSCYEKKSALWKTQHLTDN